MTTVTKYLAVAEFSLEDEKKILRKIDYKFLSRFQKLDLLYASLSCTVFFH
jgi:hypothetical protein